MAIQPCLLWHDCRRLYVLNSHARRGVTRCILCATGEAWSMVVRTYSPFVQIPTTDSTTESSHCNTAQNKGSKSYAFRVRDANHGLSPPFQLRRLPDSPPSLCASIGHHVWQAAVCVALPGLGPPYDAVAANQRLQTRERVKVGSSHNSRKRYGVLRMGPSELVSTFSFGYAFANIHGKPLCSHHDNFLKQTSDGS